MGHKKAARKMHTAWNKNRVKSKAFASIHNHKWNMGASSHLENLACYHFNCLSPLLNFIVSSGTFGTTLVNETTIKSLCTITALMIIYENVLVEQTMQLKCGWVRSVYGERKRYRDLTRDTGSKKYVSAKQFNSKLLKTFGQQPL